MHMHPASRRLCQKSLARRLTLEPLESRLLLAASPWSIDDHITVEGTRLTLRGTDAQDSFEVVAGGEYRVALNGANRQFAADSIDNITLIADDDDTIVLHDTAGDDTIYGSPDITRIVADGLSVEAFGAAEVIVVADAGGVDVAHLSDSAGDDFFVSSKESSTLSGDGFLLRVELDE